MSKTKQFIIGFLESKGATTEEIKTFGELYDKEIHQVMKSEASAAKHKNEENMHQFTTNISKLAEEARITS